MREIKFRAWNDSLKSMHNVSELYIDSDGKLKELGRFETILMQFTGLKDCNGMDIYERDIVKAWFSGMSNNMRCIQEITFNNSSFGCGGYPFHAMDTSAIKVIGNIYENPELLE